MSRVSGGACRASRNGPWPLCVLLAVAMTAGVSAGAADWPWGDELDALAAAPESHRVLLENESVRVLEVVIRPGEREPAHTHRWPSVMMVTEPARLRYYGADGELRFESPPRQEEAPSAPSELGADWLGSEGLHSVENIDDRPFRALRVELKGSG